MEPAEIERLAREAGAYDERVGQGGAYSNLILSGPSCIASFAGLVRAKALEEAAVATAIRALVAQPTPMEINHATALLPCPFCGEAHDLEVDNSDTNRSTWVICHGCGSRGAIMFTAEKATRAWNLRTALDAAS